MPESRIVQIKGLHRLSYAAHSIRVIRDSDKLPINILSLRGMIRIGKIVATHGLTGSLIMTHVAGDKNWLKKGIP